MRFPVPRDEGPRVQKNTDGQLSVLLRRVRKDRHAETAVAVITNEQKWNVDK